LSELLDRDLDVEFFRWSLLRDFDLGRRSLLRVLDVDLGMTDTSWLIRVKLVSRTWLL
jgi:hypothetical protein